MGIPFASLAQQWISNNQFKNMLSGAMLQETLQLEVCERATRQCHRFGDSSVSELEKFSLGECKSSSG